MHHREALQRLTDDLEAVQGNFTFNKMMTLLTGCVSPRSLDGLVQGCKNTVDTYKSLQCKSLRFLVIFLDVQVVTIFSVAFLALDLSYESDF